MKYTKILIGISICIFIGASLYTFCQNQKYTSVLNSMSGKLVYGDVTNNKTEHSRGMKSLDIKTNKSKYISNFEFQASDYDMRTGTVLTLGNNEEVHEFSLAKMSDRILLRNTFSKGSINQLRYIPNESNSISMQLGDTEKIYIYNLKKHEINETFFIASSGFCWLDNENIIFSNDSKIFIGNTVTKKIEYLTDGEYPQISNNKKYLVFSRNNKKLLSLYNINNRVLEKTFNFKSSIFEYRFSPDDNDIAIVQEGRKGLFYFDIDLNIINLNNRKKIKFLEGISSYDFIWVK